MIGHLLNTDLTVYRASFTADGRGGRTKAMASVGTIRAMVAQPSDQERQVAEQFGARLDALVYTAFGADVNRGDELDDGGARRWRVISKEINSRSTYERLHCTEVQGG
jgi:head-tail adaptor